MIRVLLEVLAKQARQLAGRFVVCLRVGPGLPRHEDLRRYAADVGDHLEAEYRVRLRGALSQLPGVDRIDDRPSVGQVDPGTHAVGATAPSGVHEPHGRPVLLHLSGEHLRVHGRMPNQERRAEARGKSRLGIGDADLGPGHLRRIAADEVVHRLGLGEPAHRRQHAERVAGQEDDVGRMPGDTRDLRVRDEVDRIRAAGVLGDLVIRVVHPAAVVQHDVLQNGAESERLKDVRLLLHAQIDRLRVAATFDVEDPVIRPAMLVISDQKALRIGRQRRLARPGEAEQQRRAFGRRIRGGGAMHRQHSQLGHQIVHDREDTLLHLTGVLRSENHHLAVFEAQIHRGLGEAGRLVQRGELARVVDHVVGVPEFGQLPACGPDEHVVHEQRVVRPRADHTDLEPVGRIPAGETVDAEDRIAQVEVIARPLSVEREQLRLDRRVDRPPPDIPLGIDVLHEMLVHRRASRLLARVGDESAVGGDLRVRLTPNRILVQLRRRRIATDVFHGDAVSLEIKAHSSRHR